MIMSNIDYERSSCSVANIPEIPETKVAGIFEQARQTDKVLAEIMYMLDTFKREIRNYPIPTDEYKEIEPTCFKETVMALNDKAFAIKGDLERILAEFH